MVNLKLSGFLVKLIDMNKKRWKYMKECAFCSELFQTNKENQIYCCYICSQKAQYKRVNPNAYKLYNKICPVCDSVFETTIKSKFYCSDECRGLARNTKFIWKGYSDMIEYIIERDKCICQDCGKNIEAESKEVHHIQLVGHRGSHLEENLVLLCHKCHKLRHAHISSFGE